ncbi:hypothetical protein CFT12S00416_07890 [Campylobacter fetus subsp. testudinum]|uniref:MFS transporter n=1 Tax=Campylobacter fetus TaxID=196 RepID=UPI000818BA52|nr:MFS transporter [Campylobacter fetus]OCR87739.1 hypothetical protein CFT12S00416_07890 [Campylobacter fetus subsp. testudinum]OCR98880.1 hypothetical protein A9K75_09475 [Campylobacter fetus subsp. testudinum]
MLRKFKKYPTFEEAIKDFKKPYKRSYENLVRKKLKIRGRLLMAIQEQKMANKNNICNYIKKLSKILTIALSSFILTTQIMAASYQENMPIRGDLNPYADSNENIKATCIPTCRAVKSEYIALVDDFDAKLGLTTCNIVDKNTLEKIGMMANTINETCISATNVSIPIESMDSYQKSFDNIANSTYKPNQLTLSQFLAGMVTLNPEIIDFKATDSTGMLQLKNPTSIYGTNITGTKNNSEVVAKADSFNKTNLAYFSNLFSNMQKIYMALQYILLVVVGGYFFAVMGSKNLLAKIGKNGQQINILNALTIPMIAGAAFFMPIPDENNMTSTPVQKMIRASAQWSNYYADHIGTVGSEVYSQKLYSSVGGYTVDGEKVFKENKQNLLQAKTIYSNALKECNKRYPGVESFMTKNDGIDQFNPNLVEEKYTFRACQNIERNLKATISLKRQNDLMLEGLTTNIKNDKLQTTLRQINDGINSRNNELGWINSTMIPGLSVLVENISLINDNDVAKSLLKDNTDMAEMAADYREENNRKDRDDSWFASLVGDNAADFGEFIGRALYLTLPGAEGVYNFFSNLISISVKFFGTIASGFPGPLAVIVGVFIAVGASIASPMGSLYITSEIYIKVLHYLPLVVCMVASALVFLSYIIELAKFFYISPFVTAFAFSMGKTQKLTEFLVTGLALFFKPILIVIFVYLSLFVYSLFQDIFMLFGVEQMTMMKELQNQFWLSFMLGIFKVLLNLIGTIGATYMMWKIIISAPSWVLKMVGLDGNNDILAEQLSHKMEKYSFQL